MTFVYILRVLYFINWLTELLIVSCTSAILLFYFFYWYNKLLIIHNVNLIIESVDFTWFKVNDCMMFTPPCLNELMNCCCFRRIEMAVWWITSFSAVLVHVLGDDKFSASFSMTWLLFFNVLADALELPICGWLTLSNFIGFPLSWWAYTKPSWLCPVFFLRMLKNTFWR